MPDHSDCKACTANARADDPYLVWRNDLWVLRHTRPPYAALGWMTLHSQRHAESFTALSATELADLGPTMARISTALIGATGALRVYLASMTEMTPHFHAHLVPRYADGPKGWETFKLKQQAASSTVTDESVHAVMTALRDALS
ncbi:HIT family protein [Devosia sp. XGJD_8]|uniref:HIT family protein n=1 Tax=Devosia sp. XGJD_8 TaxID=3391187 RepID=UPI003984ADA3